MSCDTRGDKWGDGYDNNYGTAVRVKNGEKGFYEK